MSEQPIIILDANAFITGSGLLDIGAAHQFVTTPAVMQELRDAKTREMLDKFVHPIKQMEPMKKSVDFVKQFAKKTGDLASLSDVDVQLIALAHTIYLNHGLEEKLRKTPPPLKQWEDKGNGNQDLDEEDYSSGEEQDKIEQTQENEKQSQQDKTQHPQQIPNSVPKQQKPEQKQSQEEDDGWIVVPKAKGKKKQESDDDMDDEQGWVTPQNYEVKMAEGTSFDNKQVQQAQKVESSGISLMTADFAMQNAAIQMGIQLKSLDGRQIKQIRRFILQCYLCWKQYKVQDNVVKLCKECGYNSLSKIAYSLSPTGQMILHRKKGWKPNQKVLEWKERKLEQQQKKKKHQHARRKKEASIFDV